MPPVRVVLSLLLILVPASAAADARNPAARGAELRQLVSERAFERADSILQQAQRDYERDPRQAQTIEELCGAFDRPDPALTAPLDEWAVRAPRSPMARLARGIHYYALGFEARGSDYWSKTSADRRSAMDAPFLQAVRDLHAALQANPRLMSGYAYLIYIAAVYGERDTVRGLFDDGRRVDPASFVLRDAYLWALQPKWGGSAVASDALIADTRQYYSRNPRLRVLEARNHRRRGDRLLEAKQYDQALAEFDKAHAIQPDHPGGQRGRARVYEATGRYPEAFASLHTAAEHGDGWAQSQLANYYLRGHAGVTPPDAQQARHWAQRAADNGQNYGKYQLGWLYLYGRGVPRDHAQAARWFAEAAAAGIPEAQSGLAALYWEGSGVPRDRERASALWREAAAQGDAYARQNLQQHGIAP